MEFKQRWMEGLLGVISSHTLLRRTPCTRSRSRACAGSGAARGNTRPAAAPPWSARASPTANGKGHATSDTFSACLAFLASSKLATCS